MKIRAGQLKTYHDAKPTRRQHTKPCSDCPFARTALAGWLGQMSPQDWVQVAHGEGVIECHTTDKLCAGGAIYRANVCKVLRDPGALSLPADRHLCFASPREFLEHHSEPENPGTASGTQSEG